MIVVLVFLLPPRVILLEAAVRSMLPLHGDPPHVSLTLTRPLVVTAEVW